MILDEAKAELIAGGLKVDLKVKQSMDNKQVFSVRARASRGGENTVAASQDTFQLNNIGYAEFA
jgi:hypothetical protein